MAALQQERGQHRHHGERQQQRGRQGEHDGQRHRAEHLALQAFEGQQRQEHDDDDQDARGHRRGHLAGGAKDQVQQRLAGRGAAFGELGLDVLDHHHRGVHQHADGDGEAAQAHQVGRQAHRAHRDEGGQRRQRQHQRHHQRCAQVAQEGQQQHQHQHDGLEESLGDGMHGPPDQLAAVVEGLHRHARREHRRQLGEALFDALDHLAGVGAAQAQHQALDGLGLAVAGDRAVAGEGADAHLGYVADPHDAAGAGLEHDGAHVVEGLDGALGAHQQGLLAFAQAAGAVVAVVGLEGGLQGGEGEATGGQGGRVGADLEAAYLAAQAVHVGHAGHGAQLGADRPVEQGALLLQRNRPFDGEHEHLAQRRGDRGEAAGGAGGQVAHHAGEALADLLAGPVDVGAVLEVERDVGQRVF